MTYLLQLLQKQLYTTRSEWTALNVRRVHSYLIAVRRRFMCGHKSDRRRWWAPWTGGPQCSRIMVTVIFIVGSMLLVSPAFSAQQSAESSIEPHSDRPCLGRDPFNLQEFRDIVSAETPPRGVQVVHAYMSVEWIGKGQLAEWEPVMPLGGPAGRTGDKDEPPPQEASYRQMQMAMFNTVTQNEFRVIMHQNMLDVILDCHEENGLTSATEGFDGVDGGEFMPRLFLPLLGLRARPSGTGSIILAAAAEPQGWSQGSDTRAMLTATTSWPWRTISQFRYGTKDESRCTGTLIGPRHLVTAAHCINEKGTNTWGTIQVAPGKNGVGNEPYGKSVIKWNPDPGTEAWYFTPWQWRDPNVADSQWDWGLIVIPDRLGDLTGWMGYVARPGSELKSVTNYNRGYPLCDNDRMNEPANCQDARLYGDSNQCGIGNFYNQGPDGWHRQIRVSCDISAGHSGSAVYHYFYDTTLNKWVPVVSMVVTNESCTTCSQDDSYPNTSRRITPGDLATISWLRETFP